MIIVVEACPFGRLIGVVVVVVVWLFIVGKAHFALIHSCSAAVMSTCLRGECSSSGRRNESSG